MPSVSFSQVQRVFAASRSTEGMETRVSQQIWRPLASSKAARRLWTRLTSREVNRGATRPQALRGKAIEDP